MLTQQAVPGDLNSEGRSRSSLHWASSTLPIFVDGRSHSGSGRRTFSPPQRSAGSVEVNRLPVVVRVRHLRSAFLADGTLLPRQLLMPRLHARHARVRVGRKGSRGHEPANRRSESSSIHLRTTRTRGTPARSASSRIATTG